MEFFYDAQIRRYLLQVVRAFSGLQYEIPGKNGNPPELRVVPCRMATQNRQVGTILRNNSENSVLSVPIITVFIKETNTNRNRTQAPSHVSTVHVHERKIENDQYTTEQGRSYTVRRMMPHPLDLTIQIDIWTSNELQKHQLFEQIYMAMNVAFTIQSDENPLDWSTMTDFNLDSINWSSRSIPVGTNDEIDVMSFTFTLPMWINPPAQVQQQRVIHQIVTNILDSGETVDQDFPSGPATGIVGGELLGRIITTPENALIVIEGDEITLLAGDGTDLNSAGNLMSWREYLMPYGEVIPAQSQLRLRAEIEQDLDLDIVGTIQFHGSKPNVLLWQVDLDTLPSNTMLPVNAVIDPLKTHPGNLPEPVFEGQRFLIISDLGSNQAWGIPPLPPGIVGQPTPMFAHMGDILEYRNGAWFVAFNSQIDTTIQYVVNLRNGKQMKFTDGTWVMAIDGQYEPGAWRLQL